MINVYQLQPSTLEVLKKISTERRDTIVFMQKYGTAFEKAIAALILEVGNEIDA